jgi:GNAT superfamily N-acetyltransferase
MVTGDAVRRATYAEIPDLAAVLARAFVRDPFFSYLAGEASERTQRMRDRWPGILRLVPALARLTGWRRVREASAAIEVLEDRRRDHAPMPHYYLSALGVEPELQGTGIGSALIAPTLAAADAAGMPAYLETATARNVLLYERHGFDVVEELILPRTDVHGWLMLRPSAGSPRD